MTNTYVISRSRKNDQYTVWAFDPSTPTLFTLVRTDPEASFAREKRLTAVGGYLLAHTPFDHDLQQLEYKLFAFSPKDSDPLNGEPVQAGIWAADKFWGGYKYRDHPHGPRVYDLHLVGITGYVLSFLPTSGRGTFCLWNFDASAATPGGSLDPLTAPMAD